jgi:LPXTG-motif cell wall-anchored protein
MRVRLLITFLLLINIGFSQEYSFYGNGIINRIFEENGKELVIKNQFKTEPLIKLEHPFENYGQFLVRNKKGSFILIDGTGRIYKATSKSNDTINYSRIDSTHFYGYNGGAINFTYHDTIFSFGGGGFWRVNGQLRYYSEKYHEWDILPLNEEVPATNELYYFDRLNCEIYYLQIPITNAAANISTEGYAIYKLNLKNRKNEKLGKMNDEIVNLFPTKAVYSFSEIPSLKAVLVNFDGANQYLFDFINNKSYKLISPEIQKLFYGNSKDIRIINTFEINNWLYYTKSNDALMQLDSVKITMADFTSMDRGFYVPEREDESKYGIAIIGILTLGGIIFFARRRKKIKPKKEDQDDETNGIGDFKSIELDLIEKIYNKSLEGKSYSVEDINAALGLSKKSLEIQKKIRTETINRINHRFKIICNTEDELIERIRLEEDRRYYKYIISEENGKKALRI